MSREEWTFTRIAGTVTCRFVLVLEYRLHSIRDDVVHQDAIGITGSEYSYKRKRRSGSVPVVWWFHNHIKMHVRTSIHLLFVGCYDCLNSEWSYDALLVHEHSLYVCLCVCSPVTENTHLRACFCDAIYTPSYLEPFERSIIATDVRCMSRYRSYVTLAMSTRHRDVHRRTTWSHVLVAMTSISWSTYIGQEST